MYQTKHACHMHQLLSSDHVIGRGYSRQHASLRTEKKREMKKKRDKTGKIASPRGKNQSSDWNDGKWK
jgi:hypothetical protein